MGCGSVSALTGKCSLAYFGAVADVYRAIADATRRQILDLLVEREEMTLFEICTRLHVLGTGSSRQAVSQHLAVLEECDLVRVTRVGRTKVHRLNTEPLREIAQRWPTE
ncbi:metalloregulator ArsR/SmtB family transcription factor [Nocardioides humi]|uniref:Metalloregulator ArsR/SmtB family transcription factor n=1 Tax=Nocardioides humi TaxID=449461 RepID=A0ABN2AH61_9ACTN